MMSPGVRDDVARGPVPRWRNDLWHSVTGQSTARSRRGEAQQADFEQSEALRRDSTSAAAGADVIEAAGAYGGACRGTVIILLAAAADHGVGRGAVDALNAAGKAAFGIVGISGLILALLYLFIRDYKTSRSRPTPMLSVHRLGPSWFRSIVFSRTARWVCISAAAQLIAVSALWSWLHCDLQEVRSTRSFSLGSRSRNNFRPSSIRV
jgi:hypothetical protein